MITNAVSADSPPAPEAVPVNQLGRDSFLMLLITQLRNQDPLRTVEDKEFIAQLAQFSALEQMQEMNQNLEVFVRSQSSFAALSLIGRTVEATDPETGNKLSGKVESVHYDRGTPILRVLGKDIPLNYIETVS